MADEKIIDRIKKLLELAASPNENEAKLAYNRAKELMIKYSVDISDEAGIADKKIIEEPYLYPKGSRSLQDVLPQLALTISQPFGVYVVMHNYNIGRDRHIRLVGFETNIKVVKHAIDSVLNQCSADFTAEFKKHRSVSFAPEFWNGVLEALIQRFKQDESAEKGIVVYDPVKNYMKKFGTGHVNRAQSDSAAARNAGMNSGNSAQIRRGVESTNTGKLIG